MSVIPWRTAKQPRQCNVFSSVWAAIHGCTGQGKSFYSMPGLYGQAEHTFACPACKALAGVAT